MLQTPASNVLMDFMWTMMSVHPACRILISVINAVMGLNVKFVRMDTIWIMGNASHVWRNAVDVLMESVAKHVLPSSS